MTAPNSSGGSLSQPSDAMITTEPRVASPWCDASSARTLVAIRVPPKRSTTDSAAASTAASAEEWANFTVRRVSEVAKAKTSASAASTAPRIRWR